MSPSPHRPRAAVAVLGRVGKDEREQKGAILK